MIFIFKGITFRLTLKNATRLKKAVKSRSFIKWASNAIKKGLGINELRNLCNIINNSRKKNQSNSFVLTLHV